MSDRDELRAIFGEYDHLIEEGYFEVDDDISQWYYDGGAQINLEATLDKILASDWLAERVRLAQEQAWNEGHATGKSRAMRYMSDEPGLKDWGSNPYTQGDKQA